MLKRKDRIYSVLCSFSFTNHVPMVPKGNHRKQSERCALPSGRSDFEIRGEASKSNFWQYFS